MAKRTTSTADSPSASLSFSKAAIVPSVAHGEPDMRPAMLDLLVLTLNCAKNLVEVPVLGEHLKTALLGEQLPEVVVFSLQEVAPLAYSFVGSYFLAPYLNRFEEALNLAAVNVTPSPSSENGAATAQGSSSSQILPGPEQEAGSWQWPPPLLSGQNNKPYTLVRAANVGMTAILLFARDPSAVRNVQVAECGFGIADMGNKGAVGIRIAYHKGTPDAQEETELTFVATHLAAMEWNLKRRNANWRSIASGLTFQNPKDAIVAADRLQGLGQGMRGRRVDSARSGVAPPIGDPEADAADQGSESGDEEEWLLSADQAAAQTRHHDALREISVFKASSHLFVAGDLNYRTAATTPATGAPFPGLHEDDDGTAPADAPDVDGASRPLLHWRHFLERDQLTAERRAGRAFRGLAEADLAFPPTYKFDILGSPEGAVNAREVEAADKTTRERGLVVPWQYAQHRWPSWCDRVLYLDVPAWARGEGAGGKVEVRKYSSLPVMRSSDHQPVFLRASVPLLGREAMAVPKAVAEAAALAAPGGAEDGEDARAGGMDDDPRVRLPVPVDVDAWERRAAARRKELMLGWTALLWSTKEGAVVIGTVVLAGVGSWWAYQWFF